MGVKGRLLLLSLYYPPDLAAGSFRAAALVQALQRAAPALKIDVLTSMPNRYQSFASAAATEQIEGNVTVRRLPMPAHRSDMRTQALAYSRFARAAMRHATHGGAPAYDLVVATSSRLMTAALGAWISRRLGVPLYLDIRDLFVDTMGDILPGRIGRVLSPGLSAVERLAMRRASHINLVSEGFGPYFARRYPDVALTFFTNGIDEEFVDEPRLVSAGANRKVHADATTARKVVLYAGNIGEGQGLHAIVPGLAAALRAEARFRIVGDGGRKPQLLQALSAAGVADVELLPPMSREQLIDQYVTADVLFLHLHDYPAFTRVLPSKIFEYAAIGRPILAGVAGTAAAFLREHVTNVAVFPPCDVDGGVQAWQSLTPGPTPRPEFVTRFRRAAVMDKMAAHVLSLMPRSAS